LKNKEKEVKEQERKRVQGLKIWQKGVNHQSEGKLRRIRELTNDDYLEDDDKMNIVDAAKSALKNRVKMKEPLLNFLNKKKGMFLFQMSINERKEQIKEFEELAHLQELSLQNSKDLLEKDAEIFKQYVEKNKNETRQAIKKAEDETKAKQKKILEMKQIQDDLSTLMSKNTKQLEKLEKLYAYKLFLDKLTPEEFLRNQKKLKEERRGQMSQSMIIEDEKKDLVQEELKWQSYNLNLSPGIIELLHDEDNDFEMYFQKPEHLQNLFENLEEKNLFIIKLSQDIEESLENFKHAFGAKQATLLSNEGTLKKNKGELDKAISTREKNIDQLHVKNDKFTEKTLTRLENAIKRIWEVSKLGKDGKTEQSQSGLDILRVMEKKLDQQLKELKTFNPQKVLEQYKICLHRRRDEMNELKKKERDQEEKDKLEKIKKRMMAEKRFGRPIMAKSMFKKQVKEVKDDESEDEEEIERRLYFTTRFQ